ncbi:hypothetical protein SDC9_191516 [bioreactor metagenome]|uniref:Uncharacterized protein n=1 Tax=bioreactor metagenome TaxID=1076179 RepID=A0A645HY34_9ZZZZ
MVGLLFNKLHEVISLIIKGEELNEEKMVVRSTCFKYRMYKFICGMSEEGGNKTCFIK